MGNLFTLILSKLLILFVICCKAAMLYNKNVDEVDIYVTNDVSKSPVRNVVEGIAKVMATQGCPTYTRDTLAPFRVLSPPTCKSYDLDWTIILRKLIFLFSKYSPQTYLFVVVFNLARFCAMIFTVCLCCCGKRECCIHNQDVTTRGCHFHGLFIVCVIDFL